MSLSIDKNNSRVSVRQIEFFMSTNNFSPTIQIRVNADVQQSLSIKRFLNNGKEIQRTKTVSTIKSVILWQISAIDDNDGKIFDDILLLNSLLETKEKITITKIFMKNGELSITYFTDFDEKNISPTDEMYDIVLRIKKYCHIELSNLFSIPIDKEASFYAIQN